ncbi:hypothetical protein D043_5231, partial [Vibrio parahaemolyticus EKP-021]
RSRNAQLLSKHFT